MKRLWKAVCCVIAAITILNVQTRAEYVTSENGLLIREAPGTDSTEVGALPFRAEVEGEIENGWMHIEQGYICAEYLSDTDPVKEWSCMGDWRVTAYAETGLACANGEYPEVNCTIACNSLPFGTEVYIEGVGFRTVEDRGPDWMGDFWLDLYMGDTYTCIQWGDQTKKVYVVD